MSIKLPATLSTGLALALALVPAHLSAQRPGIEPRLALPPGQPTATTVITQPGNTNTAGAPPDTTPPPGSANAPVTQVTGGASGVTQLGAPQQTTSSSSQAATADVRGYTAGKFALTLGGINAGFLMSAEGGSPTGDVVVEKPGADQIAHKHLAGVKYEDISFDTGLDAKPIMDWIAAMWDGKYDRKDGSVIMADYNYKPVAERQFFHALIRETTFPGLDAGSKDAARITVKLAPEYTRLVGGSGTTIPGGYGSKITRWLPANFRFEMSGLDPTDLKYVNAIESFTVTRKMPDQAVGEMRDYQKEPSQVEFPNLKITLSEAHSQSWNKWLDDFVVKGDNGQDKERNGSIVYLGPNLTTEYGRVNLYNCGIVRLTPQKLVAKSEAIRRLQAELYCERMELITPKSN